MSTGPKTNWGGPRPGSGRPRKTQTALLADSMLKLEKKYAKKYGETIDDILIGLIYDRNILPKDRLSATKLWKEYTQAKMSEDSEANQLHEPAVYLPEQDKGPELKVVGGNG